MKRGRAVSGAEPPADCRAKILCVPPLPGRYRNPLNPKSKGVRRRPNLDHHFQRAMLRFSKCTISRKHRRHKRDDACKYTKEKEQGRDFPFAIDRPLDTGLPIMEIRANMTSQQFFPKPSMNRVQCAM